MPCRLIAPCLPSSAPQAPSGDEWLHEIKHDGFRVIARKDGTRVKLYSRPGNDLTDRFPLIVEALNKLRPRSCIIDGEAVACGEDGIASFDRNFVFRLFCLRLCLRLGRADRRPPRAVNRSMDEPLRAITRVLGGGSCIVARCPFSAGEEREPRVTQISTPVLSAPGFS